MSLWALLKQNTRHIIRTRLLMLLFVFSFLVPFLSLWMVQKVTFQFQGIVSTVDATNAIWIALFVELFSGAFLAAAYGIWMVPYLHQGNRGQLTHVLPISKWYFPAAYVLSMLGLLLLQHLILLVAFGATYGFGALLDGAFPWGQLLPCLVLETLAFLTFMLGLALSSMSIGQVPTFFLGGLVVFLLQIAAGVFRLDLERFAQETPPTISVARRLYRLLPPVGELVFDLRNQFKAQTWSNPHWVLWIAWLVLFIVVFRVKIRRPGRASATEA